MDLTTLLLSQYLRYGQDLLFFDQLFYSILILCFVTVFVIVNWNKNIFAVFLYEKMFWLILRTSIAAGIIYSVSQLAMIYFYPGLYVIKNIT